MKGKSTEAKNTGKKTSWNVPISEEVIKNTAISAPAFRLYVLLLCYARAKTTCFPSRQTLADDLGCSVRTIDNLKKELSRLGLLSWDHEESTDGTGRRWNANNTYTLPQYQPLGKVVKSYPEGEKNCSTPERKSSSGRRKIFPPNNTHTNNTNKKNTTKKSSVELNDKQNELIEVFINSWNNYRLVNPNDNFYQNVLRVFPELNSDYHLSINDKNAVYKIKDENILSALTSAFKQFNRYINQEFSENKLHMNFGNKKLDLTLSLFLYDRRRQSLIHFSAQYDEENKKKMEHAKKISKMREDITNNMKLLVMKYLDKNEEEVEDMIRTSAGVHDFYNDYYSAKKRQEREQWEMQKKREEEEREMMNHPVELSEEEMKEFEEELLAHINSN